MNSVDAQRLELLREALPYIQRFHGKTFVIKLSGKVTESEDVLLPLAEEIALLYQVGFQIVIVHGGGKQLSQMAEQMGVPQTIVNGRRVTDKNTLELAKMVFAGQIRTNILSALRGFGVKAVGISGIDGGIIRAKRRDVQEVTNRETGMREWVDFGHVGDIEEVDTQLVRTLLNERYIPILSSLGADEKGNIYNINADTIASEVAVGLQAEKLILLSNVDGIYRDFEDPTSKISRLTDKEALELYESKGIGAGMLPKIAATLSLLRRGVRQAHILNGTRRNVLLQEIFTDAGSGTMIFRSEAPSSLESSMSS